MQVYKFGGGVLNSPEGLRKLIPLMKMTRGSMIVVVSAFGKTTNALEKLTDSYFREEGDEREQMESLRRYHLEMTESLFPDKGHEIYERMEGLFGELGEVLSRSPEGSYDRVYDRIVGFGELFSSTLVSAWLGSNGIKNRWQDIRECLQTDDCFRDGKIQWDVSESRVREVFRFDLSEIWLTQGFIAASPEGHPVTLGREGSDYTAAVLAGMLDAEKVVIWKDVPGVLNADPKWMSDTSKLDEISYLEAVELSYYGAQVIHPKTIKPLENKKIPLYVKAYDDPGAPGTLIHEINRKVKLIPVYIRKQNQMLITVLPRDYSFVVEESLGVIFGLFNSLRVRCNLVQSSAISISLCVDVRPGKVDRIIEALQEQFNVRYNSGLELITIRHYDEESVQRILRGKTVMIQQRTRNTAYFVLKNEESGEKGSL